MMKTVIDLTYMIERLGALESKH